VAQFRFDLVLSDLRMPRIGLTLARHIVFKGPPTPVLLMTAYAANDLDALSELRGAVPEEAVYAGSFKVGNSNCP